MTAPATPQAHPHATPEDSAVSEMTTRADALRGLTDKVASNEFVGEPRAVFPRNEDWSDCEAAQRGSLDAVARLEAPLRERGWRQNMGDDEGLFFVEMHARALLSLSHKRVTATHKSEPRARLLAVLRAYLHEEEAR